MDNEHIFDKCGCCQWVFANNCQNFNEHECVSTFNEAIHEFVADEQSFIFMVEKLPDTPDVSLPDTPDVLLSDTSDLLLNPNLGKLKWTHEAIMCLINLYKKHQNDFALTKYKNDKVWGWISNELNANSLQYTANQCKYLKAKYVQKKDNMKSTSSGEACVKFKYFNELDAIFGTKPNVKPVAVASNLVRRKRLRENLTVSDDILSNDYETENETGNQENNAPDGLTDNNPQPIRKRLRPSAKSRENDMRKI
ncbi:unnamed protein product [Brassicogethes aeneus]|uniref:Myb/SANT-like DNA-binding domain-containing protein n=1 Tax=Brassicogethes aeneus TaxID=1431903 RepID=A0A9P0B6Z9_BRAAE|nr:unnamed protein product [Brassicogethes aeneus]